jgi:uncharacterized protein YjdB
MKYHFFGRRFFAFVLSLLIIFHFDSYSRVCAADSTLTVIILTQYSASLSVGEEFYLGAFVSTAKQPTFKSSDSKVASVSTYGRVTAKQAGSCRITVKSGNGEASCKITVKKTTITLNSKKVSLENGASYRLTATTSSGTTPTFSSNKKSVAVVDSNGLITACKVGTAVISVKADKTTVTCTVTVKSPTISLTPVKTKLFRCQQVQLTADISSGVTPTWKSNKTSVATVDDMGLVTAQKHGNATITVKADGVSKTCDVQVESPTITLSSNSITMKVGKTKKITYTVSSGNTPVIKSSKPSVVKVDSSGNLTAKSAGASVISFTEDGTRETCKVKVTN